MKKIISIVVVVFISFHLFAVNVPKATNFVNDYASVLSAKELGDLNAGLKAYKDSTSNEIAVLVIMSYNDREEGPLFDFTRKVFDTWKIGQKNKNNGVLLVVVQHLVSRDNNPGLRIYPGYGLESVLPDVICRRIIEEIRPLINKGEYYAGISLAVKSMATNIKDEFKSDKPKKEEFTNTEMAIIIFAFIFLLIIFLVIGAGASGGSSSGSSFVSYSSSSSDSSGSSSFDGFGGGGGGGAGAGD